VELPLDSWGSAGVPGWACGHARQPPAHTISDHLTRAVEKLVVVPVWALPVPSSDRLYRPV
jgi:hypothetical protein